ncbi:MAG: lipoyl(octanoyl) transferase LipB [Flavobacteriales bacterium]|nr:lipoyl(octanoyl) transferase LipB [Flavobacteriales bacterium]MDG1779431.1 lipoyl(octanoyl) transferase LipB [Flavobacteriales bacterium]MDG2245024.1 lipoyl(octanoyl) transferase LipB [Flavobacteriales bacterium]
MLVRKIHFQDLGHFDYKACWDYQEELFAESVNRKIAIRKGEDLPQPKNHLLFVEHPPVFTLGKSGEETNLLLSQDQLKEQDISYYKINRGGDITYHGPGQVVGYPIFDLDQFFTDIHKYLRYLEEAIILMLSEYKIEGDRIDGLTGVWIGKGTDNPRKIAALGVKCSRWVTMHGFALNVNTELGYFDKIIPCGIDDKAVTSMAFELGEKVDESEVKEKLKMHLSNLFDADIVAS